MHWLVRTFAAFLKSERRCTSFIAVIGPARLAAVGRPLSPEFASSTGNGGGAARTLSQCGDKLGAAGEAVRGAIQCCTSSDIGLRVGGGVGRRSHHVGVAGCGGVATAGAGGVGVGTIVKLSAALADIAAIGSWTAQLGTAINGRRFRAPDPRGALPIDMPATS